MGENPTEEESTVETATATVALGATVARHRMLAARLDDFNTRTMMLATIDLVNAAVMITLTSPSGQLDLNQWLRYLPAPTMGHVLAAILIVAFRFPPTVDGVEAMDQWLTQIFETLGEPVD